MLPVLVDERNKHLRHTLVEGMTLVLSSLIQTAMLRRSSCHSCEFFSPKQGIEFTIGPGIVPRAQGSFPLTS